MKHPKTEQYFLGKVCMDDAFLEAALPHSFQSVSSIFPRKSNTFKKLFFCTHWFQSCNFPIFLLVWNQIWVPNVLLNLCKNSKKLIQPKNKIFFSSWLVSEKSYVKKHKKRKLFDLAKIQPWFRARRNGSQKNSSSIIFLKKFLFTYNMFLLSSNCTQVQNDQRVCRLDRHLREVFPPGNAHEGTAYPNWEKLTL